MPAAVGNPTRDKPEHEEPDIVIAVPIPHMTEEEREQKRLQMQDWARTHGCNHVDDDDRVREFLQMKVGDELRRLLEKLHNEELTLRQAHYELFHGYLKDLVSIMMTQEQAESLFTLSILLAQHSQHIHSH